MKKILLTLVIGLFFSPSLSVGMSTEESFGELLELHRKIIFLTSSEGANVVAIERDTFIARNFYVEKRERLEELEESLESDNVERDSVVQSLITFMNRVDSRAADALAFIDLLDAVLEKHDSDPFLNTQEIKVLENFERQIEVIQTTYREELSSISEKLQTRGLELEPWDAYIKFLSNRYDRDDIYRTFNEIESRLAEPATRGAESKKDAPELIWGFNLPENTVVLTFDDGPHHRNTPKVLDILKTHDAKGYFFAVGKNIGGFSDQTLKLGKKSQILSRALSEGHLLANHSFSHKILTKLDKESQKLELAKTNQLLTAISGYENVDFRPPYGSKNESLLSLSKELGMRAIMWNIDSKDWADPIPDSIVDRVMSELNKRKKGVLLFHDIHKQTVQALPILLSKLRESGYRIVMLDGNEFPSSPVGDTRGGTDKVDSTAKSDLYGESWALVVGINKYKYWPQLTYAVNDATGVSDVLQRSFGFKKDHIIELFDEDATRANITEVLTDTFSDSTRVKPNDRVFVFYAGHGMTRRLPSGRNLGYLVPVDAELNKYSSKSISMTHLQDFSDMIPAKHVYFVMDSCYSGIALTRGATPSMDSKYLKEISSRRARQILTAGGADQEVADGGPQGHSIFTWALLRGLEGEADLDNNRIITASELGSFLAPIVSDASSQTPAFGNLVGTEGGEFLFELSTGAEDQFELSEEEALRAEVDRLNKQIEALQRELLAAKMSDTLAQAQNESGSHSSMSHRVDMNVSEIFKSVEVAETRYRETRGSVDVAEVQNLSPSQRRYKANDHHRKGLDFYKEKEYEAAIVELKKALIYNPANVGVVNDYGYILFQDGNLDEALVWLEKTIEMDADRVPVYVNIADVLVGLGRSKEAIPYYQYYIELYPDTPFKTRIERFLRDNS